MKYVEDRVKITKNNISINIKGLSSTKKEEVNKLLEKIKKII
jgi:hypothetical protein